MGSLTECAMIIVALTVILIDNIRFSQWDSIWWLSIAYALVIGFMVFTRIKYRS